MLVGGFHGCCSWLIRFDGANISAGLVAVNTI
nr:MAG TPA: hypothetical protein [Caudoviricetes sp.]